MAKSINTEMSTKYTMAHAREVLMNKYPNAKPTRTPAMAGKIIEFVE